MNTEIWDVISISVIGFIIYPLVMYFINKDYYHLIFLSGILTCAVVAHLIKYVMYEYKRPKGACNCGTLNNNSSWELSTGDEPGMPSGHVATTTFFFVYLALYRHNVMPNIMPLVNHVLYYVFAITSIILMAMARYYKKCHDIPQIVGGVVLGFTMALFYWICFLEGYPFIKRVLKG